MVLYRGKRIIVEDFTTSIPTMKSLDADKKASKVSKVAPAKVSEKVDFSNVKIEPIFEKNWLVRQRLLS